MTGKIIFRIFTTEIELAEIATVVDSCLRKSLSINSVFSTNRIEYACV